MEANLKSKAATLERRRNVPEQWPTSLERRKEPPAWRDNAVVIKREALAKLPDTEIPPTRSDTATSSVPGLRTQVLLHAFAQAFRSLQQWFDGYRVRRQLSALDNRQMQDMGLNRGDIDAVADGTIGDDATRVDRR
jgi:uncharacterized protein YjiS (DUF1127 family)